MTRTMRYACLALALVSSACAGSPNVEAATTPSPARTAAPTTAEAELITAPSSTTSTTAAATSTTTSTTSTTTTLPPITIGFAGDTSFTHGLHDRDPLGGAAEALRGPDLMIVNLETTVAEPDVGRAINKRFTFKSPPVTGELLADAGVDVAALANNHALDFGPEAVARTIEILQGAGVATVGTGKSAGEAYAALRLDIAGWEIAVLSFSRVPCDAPEPGETFIAEVAWACPAFEERTAAAVTAAADADFTVVMVHWGVQRDVCPARHQQELAATWAAAGADAVIGSHPHVLQGVERIDGALVIHSTGNFAFPSARNASSYTALFELTLSQADERLRATPMRIVRGRPVIADTSRSGILDDLTDRSIGYAFEPSGELVTTTAAGRCG